MFAVTYLFATFDHVPIAARILAFVFIFWVYEPVALSLFGGTIGHFANGIRVKRDDDLNRNIAIHVSMLRFLVKVLLGVISLFTVGSNPEGKAIHDIVARSVVVKAKS
jgi:uncharacterized RDD family membrane protein YckC